MTEEQESFAALLPPDFIVRMRRALGRELEPFLAALADPPLGLRVNTLRLEPERFAALSPFPLDPLPFPPAGYVVADGGARPGRHPYHAAGLYYLQDPGAMAVAALVAPRPGERVLDLAAAPGGKATHLAALMEGEGVLVANDIHPGRARELAGNLERCGVRNAVVTSERPARLAERWPGFFDRVLVDAPCSGESMFHKSAAARGDWNEAAIQGCARRQSELLASAARLVRPGGLLVYSTCTFSEEENEQVVRGFLREHADFETAPLPAVPGGDPVDLQGDSSGCGRPTTPGDAAPTMRSGATALRLWPHRVLGAGHFIAAFRRADTAASHALPSVSEWRPPPPPDAALRHFEEMRGATLDAGIALPESPALFGSELVDVPAGTPNLERLRVVPALWMAASLLWILDASINTSMEPFRAFVADKLDAAQRTAGYVMQAFFIGIGASLANALPFALSLLGVAGETASGIPLTVMYSFQIGAFVFFLAVLWTVVTTREEPPEDMDEWYRQKAARKGLGIASLFRDIAGAAREMPATMKQLAVVQVFTWLGLFCMWMFFVPATARHVFGATDPRSELYTQGIEWGGFAFAFYSITCFAVAFALPGLARRTSRKTVHAAALVCGGIGLLSVYVIQNQYLLLLTMVGVGIAWASILAMPYAILSHALPARRMGVYMGLFNAFIVIPEIIAAVGLGPLIRLILGEGNPNAPLYVVMFGGACLLMAAAAVPFVRDLEAEAVPSMADVLPAGDKPVGPEPDWPVGDVPA